MQELVRELTENLDATTRLYEHVLATERHKQRAIVEARVEALPDIVAMEEHLMGAAADLAAQRLALRDRFAGADARLGPTPRLAEIIELLDGPTRDALAARHEHLLALAEDLKEVNRTNFHLLRSSLDLLRGVLEDVLGAPAEPTTYDPRGRTNPGAHDPARMDQVM